ncbi:hypothetical protein PSPO01_04508 [Paraphaeosphaeria sporulosa]
MTDVWWAPALRYLSWCRVQLPDWVIWVVASIHRPHRQRLPGAKFLGENVRVGLRWNFGRPVEGREKAALWARISHKPPVSGAAHDKSDQTVAKDGEIHLLSESGQWSSRPTPDTGTGEQTPAVSDFDASDSHYGRAEGRLGQPCFTISSVTFRLKRRALTLNHFSDRSR